MTSLSRRLIVEKRWMVLPLAFAAVANLAVYVFVVRPLASSSAGAADRAAAAAADLTAATREAERARSLEADTDRAVQKLQTFYKQVLPADRTAARRMTYAPLADLAARNRVTYNRGSREVVVEEEMQQLARLQTRLELQGPYERVRQFIYDLESASEFIIIDEVALSEQGADEGAIALSIGVSTYFRLLPGTAEAP